MAVPVCPNCGASIQPDWDWCHECGFDPDGLRPAAPSDGRPAPAATSGAAADGRPAPPPPRRAPDVPPSSLRPHDLLRPRGGSEPSEPLTGPLRVPEPDVEHKPLTLDDLRRSSGSAAPTASTADTAAARAGDASATGAAAPAPVRDRFSSGGERSRPPRPSDLAAMPTGPAKPAEERPPLFPQPPGPPAALATERSDDGPATGGAGPEPEPEPVPDPIRTVDEQHPYLDLPYDDPSPAPGSEPEPDPPSRLRRRRAQDDRPNAATMAMAAGRIPSDGRTPAEPSEALPPPPPGAAAGGTDTKAAPKAPPAAVERPSAPADTSSLGPIVFGSSSPAAPSLSQPKPRSSPLSVAAILMTIAIAAIVLWPTYKNLLDSESGPALPPPSAGAIGYAPAGADGSRAPVDPKRTASWETLTPPGAGFEVDMPGVVIVRSPTIPLDGQSGTGTVVSSSSGRGGYVVAAIDPATGTTFASLPQATEAILAGFNSTTGNELKAGAPTTMGGVPAITVEGTVDGVPSKGAVALVGNRAYLAVAGNVNAGDRDRFLASFGVVDGAAPATTTSSTVAA